MIILGFCAGLLIAYYIKKPYRKLSLEILNNGEMLTENEVKFRAVKLGKNPRIMWNVYKQEAKKYSKQMKKLNK